MKNGATIDVACNVAEVNRSTFFRWQKDANQIYNDLAEEKIQSSKLNYREKRLNRVSEKGVVRNLKIRVGTAERDSAGDVRLAS